MIPYLRSYCARRNSKMQVRNFKKWCALKFIFQVCRSVVLIYNYWSIRFTKRNKRKMETKKSSAKVFCSSSCWMPRLPTLLIFFKPNVSTSTDWQCCDFSVELREGGEAKEFEDGNHGAQQQEGWKESRCRFIFEYKEVFEIHNFPWHNLWNIWEQLNRR